MEAVVAMEENSGNNEIIENSENNEIIENSENNEMNSGNNEMETAENQKALEEAKEEAEKVWKNAFKVEAWKSIKPDDLYKQIVEAIKKKERNEKFRREDKQGYNWSVRFERKLLNGKFELLKDGKIVVKESKLFDILYSNHIELGHAFQEQARRSQKRQADKMVEVSNKRFKPLEIGDNVRVAVAEIDRAKYDPRNVLGIVLEKQNDLYRIGTKHGRFSRLFARNQIEPVAEKFMDASEVPDTEMSSIRTAAAADSVVGGQGHVHCDCLMKCQTKRCKCKKEGRLCNSRCHNQRDCCNK